jgi:hypothetical protein
MVEKPDITVASLPDLVQDWWQWVRSPHFKTLNSQTNINQVLVSISLAATAFGLFYIGFKLISKLHRHFAKKV